MLVLTQKEGEVLQLGDDIRIYIKKVRGNMVRLCIDAPREISILRVPATPSRRPFQRPGDGTDPIGAERDEGLELRPEGSPTSAGSSFYSDDDPSREANSTSGQEPKT